MPFADFLDLHAEGPTSWRQEISEGMASSAKCVTIIDAEYLKSFNCLMEVATALTMGKAMVPVVIEDEV
jgi:hypothetical protein